MFNKLFFIFILLVSSIPTAFSEQSRRDTKQLTTGLESYLAEINKTGFSGSVLVDYDNTRLLNSHFYSAGNTIDSSSCFFIASLTKSIAAAAIVKLATQNKLDLQATITRYLPNVPEDKKTITIHQLLTHTAGFGGSSYIAESTTKREQAIKDILSLKLARQPGVAFDYSNDGYNLLAIIMEIVTDKTYEDVIKEQILTPAGMNNTHFWQDQPSCLVSVKNYVPNTKGIRHYGLGSGGLISTSVDLIQWSKTFSNGSVFTEDEKRLITQPHEKVNDSAAYGYGWFVRTSENQPAFIRHGGADDDLGHFSKLWRFPDAGLTVIVLTNEQTEEVTDQAFLGIYKHIKAFLSN